MTFAGIIFLLKRIGFFIADNWRFVLVCVALLIVVIGLIATNRYCNKRAERKAIEKTTESITESNKQIIKTEIESNTAAKNLENANAKTKEVETNRQSNVSFDEANRNRCKVFPERCK